MYCGIPFSDIIKELYVSVHKRFTAVKQNVPEWSQGTVVSSS